MEEDQRTAKMTVFSSPQDMVLPLDVSLSPRETPETSLVSYIPGLPQSSSIELVQGFMDAGFTRQKES